MRNEHLELDEEFKKILGCGTRQEKFKYRNSIIDELNRRGKNKSPYVTEKEEIGTIAKVGRIVRRGEIYFLELIAGFAIADAIRRIVLFTQGKADQIIVIFIVADAILAVAAIARALVHTALLRDSMKEEDTFSALLASPKEGQDPLREQLASESLEILQEKKRLLDEKLGL